MIRTQTFLAYLTELWEFMDHHNHMAPFPPYDTDYVNDIKNKIEEMKNSDKDYDSIPVAACSYCNSLHIEVDEFNNDHCMRCGSVNELTIYENIEKYLEAKNSTD